MASMTVKATYSLDPDTVRSLDNLARRWGVTKSEALRRAIRGAAAPGEACNRLELLDKVVESYGLTPREADAWVAESSAIRRASSGRSERRRR
jgi:predicted transcriptional regulator